jgi:site-specific DNA recombinase
MMEARLLWSLGLRKIAVPKISSGYCLLLRKIYDEDMEILKTGIIYCRVSSKEQIEGTSLDSQERACREYTERNGIKILETYVERGESAKTANRTEFNKALAFCTDKKNKVTFFIVYKLDRFARNQDDHVTVRAILRRAGTDLRSVTEPIDETPIGRAMEGVLSVFAEFDNNVRTERTKGGMLERLKQGVWPWIAPLGYFRPYQGSNIVPEEAIGSLIRLGFEEYSKGTHTFASIADFLNERGLKTKLGKPLTPQLMEKMLKNPLYCGVMKVWGEYEGAFDPIVSKSLFAKCQPDYIQSTQASPRSANNPVFPLRRLIVCDECRIPLTGSTSKGRHGKGYSYYHHHDKQCQKTKSIPKEAFEQQFVEYLDGISPDSEYEKLFKAIVLDIWKNNYKKIDEENEQINKQISTLTSERQKIFDFHLAGKYTDEEFEEQKKRISESISQKRLLIREKWDEEFEMEEVLEYCFSYVRNTSKSWIEADYKEKIRLQKLVFAGRIEFDGKKLGTAELRQVYKINQTFQSDKSSLVAPRGVEPLLPG